MKIPEKGVAEPLHPEGDQLCYQKAGLGGTPEEPKNSEENSSGIPLRVASGNLRPPPGPTLGEWWRDLEPHQKFAVRLKRPMDISHPELPHP